jgi:glycerophosphoryl diester phosphodiesterase
MLVVAHRGASGRAPENTIASYEAALAIGVDAIELDVHLSRDGHLVVIHDANLGRTTDGQGLVHEHTLAELKRLDAGGWFAPAFAGERIPSFEEVLERIGPRVPLQVEIKGRTDGVTEATVEALRTHGLLGSAMITSFHLDVLPLVRKLVPKAEIGALVWGRRRPGGEAMTPAECVAATRAAQADVMLLWHECIDEAMLAAGREARLPVGAAGGTATEADIRRLVALADVVRITTNYPDMCKAVVGKAGAPAARP